MAAFNGFKFEIFFLKFPLKPNWLYFRALFDIVPNDTGPPILVWRDSNEKNTSGYTTGKYVQFENT